MTHIIMWRSRHPGYPGTLEPPLPVEYFSKWSTNLAELVNARYSDSRDIGDAIADDYRFIQSRVE